MLSHFPTQPTPLVGRTQELTDISARLANPGCRLLTVTGGGGSGKTRLTIAAAEASQAAFEHGVVFVDLQPVRTNDLLVTTIANALGFTLLGDAAPQPQLFHYLHDKSVLIVLDNFEHLLESAEIISSILAHAAGVKILISSREALNLQEEWLYPLRGMATPYSIYSDSLESYEAVQLFMYHARRIQPHFNFADQSEAVIRICQAAQGLPLAIELAAAWLKGLSAEQIALEMQGNLDFLATTARNVEERHRSIRAAFDQSWKLLSEDERLTFAKLSAFCGGFEREAAEKIAGASLPMLVTLVEKSLLTKQPDDRWDVHELLRQYGEEQLTSLGIMESAFGAHSRYYANFMQKSRSALKSSAQLETLAEIEGDFNNIRTAWNWAITSHDDALIDVMLDSLYHFGFIRSRFRETLEMFQQALDQPRTNQRLTGRLLARRWGYLHWLSQEGYSDALDDLHEALAIATAARDRFEVAFCKLMIGYVRIHTQAFADARRILHESLALFHELDEPFYESWVLHRIGYTYFNTSDLASAIEWTEKSLVLARSAPNQLALANCLYNLAGFHLLIGNYTQGLAYCEAGMSVVRSIGHKGQIAHTTALLSLAAFLRGDFVETRRLAQEGWRIGEDVIAPMWLAYPLTALILLNCAEENYDQADRLVRMAQAHGANSMGFQLYYWACAVLAFGVSDEEDACHYVHEALRLAHHEGSLTIEMALLPSAAYALASTEPLLAIRLLAWIENSPDRATGWVKRWARVERLRDDLRDQVGVAVFDQEWTRGASMEWELIRETLLEEFQTPREPILAAPHGLDSLTVRELEVLQLLATGLTNPQIADQLVIGSGTVKTHTLNIYRKLDVANRSQAILRAQDLGLLPV